MTSQMHYYSVYGLTVASEFEMPELRVSNDNNVDVTIRRGDIDRPLPTNETGTRIELGPDLQIIDWTTIGKFNIVGTSEIVVDIKEGVSEALMRVPLLGSVMALLLQLRGQLVLHGSAVRMGEGSVGFLGDKMAGKSTTAGAFVSSGHKLLTDDVLPIITTGVPLVVPGFAQMKFTAESAAQMKISGAEVLEELIHPQFQKRQHSVQDHFSQELTKLGQLYILQRAKEPAIEEINATLQFQILVRFSFMHRFGKDSLRTLKGAEFTRQCAALADLHKVSVLRVPDDISRVFEVVPLVEKHLNG
ncbi:hypothetical protein [Asticcacaulis sp. 201]|uniref:hypothetical protein n=1 Tax=Asticcacaulis sp. 201 TaxID=3028787 RepID=UPI0029163236|nr:hypothetical protein [Asticcacaulis sp. 201]MDV6331089.1 hypothetical protein [Asticcacaulis sp. 201]